MIALLSESKSVRFEYVEAFFPKKRFGQGEPMGEISLINSLGISFDQYQLGSRCGDWSYSLTISTVIVAWIVKQKISQDNRGITEMIQENIYLQYFFGVVFYHQACF